jgi:hypothetical protein
MTYKCSLNTLLQKNYLGIFELKQIKIKKLNKTSF